MEDNSQRFSNYSVVDSNVKTGELSKTFMANVFLWMFAALGISAFMAFLFASNLQLISLLVNENGLNILGWVVMLAPLGFVMLMSFGYNRLSVPAMRGVK